MTGLVQEFQFGMNWSDYSRFVGDVFGAPLAMEGLAAFFLESTFLGLWIFGWNRLPQRVHLRTIWAVAVGGALSAAFIMAANSWMQHPVGYEHRTRTTGGPQLTDIWAVLTNPVFLWGYAARAARLAGHRGGRHARRSRRGTCAARLEPGGVRAARPGWPLVVLVPAALFALLVGSELGVIEAEYQPMKIAAAEAQWETCQPCSFSLFQIGGGNNDQTPTKIIAGAAPAVAARHRTLERPGEGLNELQAQYEQQYGPGNYVPNVFIQYWSMRVMAYVGGAVVAARPVGPVAHLATRLADVARGSCGSRSWAVPLPFIVNTAGWMLTENGRQPWIVQGLQLTKDGVSPSVGTGTSRHQHRRVPRCCTARWPSWTGR